MSKMKEPLEAYQAELQRWQAAARRLAQQFDVVFVLLQEPLSKAVAKSPLEYWV
jgi:hypothetical protein